jgi:hypothetical protein
MLSATTLNKAKPDILKSLWMGLMSKGGYIFSSGDDTVSKQITYKNNCRIFIKDNKDNTCKEVGIGVKDVQEILSKLSKTFNIATETTIECTIDSGYLIDSTIDWNVFTAANITCYRNMGRKHPEEFKKDLKNSSGKLDGFFDQYQFRNSDSLSTVKITLPLDMDYISSSIILPFIMGTHKRLGTRSLVSSLDKDTLSLIVSQC